jgi:curved DNA-binding protein
VEADMKVTLEELLHGSRRKISFRRSSNSKVETYEVQVPAGVHEGQRIRLAGQGESHGKGGVAGDLYLRVRLSQHPDFRVEGADLVHELDLPPWRAVLGGEVSVPTMEGEARLKIPPGTQHGQRFKLKRRGLPQKGRERGDLYVAVEIVLPKELNEQERKLWEQLATDSRNPAI